MAVPPSCQLSLILKGKTRYRTVYLVKSCTEALKHSSHVSTSFHGNHSSMILLIDPHKKIFFLIVPDPAGIRPVTCHSRARQQRRNWFVKQEVVCDKLFLLSVCHPVEWVVPDGKGMFIIYDDDRVGKIVTKTWKIFVQNWRATELLEIQTTGFWIITRLYLQKLRPLQRIYGNQ